MRHRVSGRKFSRVRATREAFIKSLERDIIEHRQILTTEARAKTLRQSVEKLITMAKGDVSVMNKNRLLSRRHDAATIKRLKLLATDYAKRSGGYTKIIKTAPRRGDGTAMAVIKMI